MPQLKRLVPTRAERRLEGALRPLGRAPSRDDLALLRVQRSAAPTTLPAADIVSLARQIGNRAAHAYVARVPGNDDLDALLGGGPRAPQATAEPPVATPQEAAATPAEVTLADTAAGREPETADEANPPPSGHVPGPKVSPRNMASSSPPESPMATEPAVGGKPPKPLFVPRPEMVKPGAEPNQLSQGGSKGPGAVSRPEAQPATLNTPAETQTTQAPTQASTTANEATSTAQAATPQAPETSIETETATTTRTAEAQSATQAESAGQAVASEVQAAEARVDETTAQAQATETEPPTATQAEATSQGAAPQPSAAEMQAVEPAAGPAAEPQAAEVEPERQPTWLGAARQALQRVLGLVGDRARQALRLVDGLGTRIVDLARQGVQAATRAIRTAGALIAGAITRLLASLSGTLSAILSRAQSIAREIREAAGRAVNWVLSVMGDVGERIRNGVTSFLQSAYRRLVPMVRNMRLNAERALTTLTSSVVNAIILRGQQLRQMIQRLVAQVIERIRLLRLGIRLAIEMLLNGDPPAPEAAARWVRERLRRTGLPTLQAVGDALTRGARGAMRGIREALRAVVDPLASAYRGAANLMRISVMPVVEGAREYAPEIMQEAEIGAGIVEVAAQTVNSAIDTQVVGAEAAVQEGAAALASEINAVAEA